MSRLKVLVGGGLTHPALGSLLRGAYGGRIPSHGVRVDVRSPHIPAANAASIWWGLYEKSEVRSVQRFLRANLDVVELGSSIGVVTMQILRVQEEARRLVCVEANPRLIGTIEANIRANFPGRRADLLNRALDYSGGREALLSLGDNNLGSAVTEVVGGAQARVPTTTLDELVTEFGLGEFAVVADIEGAEAGMIMLERRGLRLCRQLIIELHETVFDGRRYGVGELRSALETLHGFRLVSKRNDVHVFER